VRIGTVRLTGLALAAMSASFALRLSAQNLSIGGAVGANLTSNFQPFSLGPGLTYTGARTVLAGGTVEWRLPGAFSIEAYGLYRRLHTPFGPTSTFSVVTWEFPVLAKWRFPLPGLTPFLEAGPSFRAAGNLNNIHPSHYGFAAGFGVERQVGRLCIAPAVRYTHWGQDLHAAQFNIWTKTDQLEFLVGFRAPSPSNGRPLGSHLSLGLVVGSNVTSDFGRVTSSSFPDALANSGLVALPPRTTFVNSAGPRSFMGGPSIVLALPKHFSMEVQAIYRPWRSSVQAFLPDGRKYLSYQDHRTSWEFPVLAQRRWRTGRADPRFAPFVEVGPAFRLLQDVYGTAPYGIAAGAGVETRLARLRLAPGVRFTHWAQHTPSVSTDPRRSELAVLTGLSF
jgi:hypothetical protein